MPRKTTAKATRAVKLAVTAEASAAAVMDAVVAAAEANEATVRMAAAKDAQKAVQRADGQTAAALTGVMANDASAVLISVTTNNAQTNAESSAQINGLKARSSWTSAHNGSRVNRARVAGKTAPAVSVVTGVSAAVSSAQPQTVPSKT